MDSHLSLIAAAAIGNICLGTAVLARQPRHSINRRFAVFSFSVATWTLCSGLVTAYPDAGPALLLARLAFASASAIPLAFLLFSVVFPTDHPAPADKLLMCFLVAGGLSITLSLTPLVVRSVASVNGTLKAIYGPLHLPFGIYFISCLGFSLFLLTRKLTVLTGFQKLQVRYLFFGVLSAAVGATISSLVIPLLIGSSRFSRYGPLFGLVMIAVIAHSIIRHRLMNIRLIVRRGFVYLLAVSIAGGFFATVVLAASRFFEGRAENVPLALQVAVGLTIALAFQPLKARLQSQLDKYVYRESYDYQRIIRAASKTIGSTLDLASLFTYVCRITNEALRPDSVAVFTRRDSTASLIKASSLAVVDVPDKSTPHISPTSPLVAFLTQRGLPLLRDEVGRRYLGDLPILAASELLALNGEIAVPMFSEGRLIGIFVVGQKLSGDAFFAEDVELLSTLADQTSVAVTNAELYRRVVLANEYIENILGTMDSAVITVDANGRVAVCNSTAERLTGLPRATLLSLSVSALPASLSLQLQSTLTDGLARPQVEATLSSGGQSWLPIVSSTSALRDDKGAIVGALIVFSDLSKLKALESDKRRAERLAAFGTLVSGIAHEIKNPLVAIKTFAELLPERYTEQDFREDFSKVVIGEIERIDDLVARLRGLAAPSPQAIGPVDIREPLIETLVLLRAQLEHTRTIVHRHFEDADFYVAIDSAQLKQLFLNLFLNAIEAMGPGGEITIRLHRRYSHGSHWVVAEVTDTGPGIPESIRSSIFNPFFTTKPRGSGLGLAICRGITDAHKGAIRAESGSHGTTIVVEFPSASRSAQQPLEEHVLRS